MPTLSRFHEIAASQEQPHDKVKQKMTASSRGRGNRRAAVERTSPPTRVAGIIRTALNESLEILMILVLWISGMSLITTVGADEIHRLIRTLVQFSTT
jgi:hypothetical protein